MRVLGIDPGLRNLGWGVVDVAGARLSHVANGICHSAPGEGDGDLALRLVSLYEQLTDVLRRFMPDHAAVEHTFVNKDAVATLKLGQARGIALLVPAQAGITALSLVMAPELRGQGALVALPPELHRPLRQRMVLLAKASAAAVSFYQYLQQAAARAVLAEYGFGAPP